MATDLITIIEMSKADCLNLGRHDLDSYIDVLQQGMDDLRKDKCTVFRANALMKRIDQKGVLTDKDKSDRADAQATAFGDLRPRSLLYKRAETKKKQLQDMLGELGEDEEEDTNPVDGAVDGAVDARKRGNTASVARSVRRRISGRKRGNTASVARSVRRRISGSDDEEESGEENGGGGDEEESGEENGGGGDEEESGEENGGGGDEEESGEENGGGGDVSFCCLSEDEDEDEVESHAGNDGSSNNGVGVVQPQQQIVGRGANNANSVLGGRRMGREANTEVDGRQEFMDYLKKGQRKMESKKKGWYLWPFF